jgi:hypothetical protein
MTTTNFSHAWVLALSVLSACELPPDLLEAGGDGDSSGDGDGDTSGDGDGDTTGDTGDTDEPESDEFECWSQGTNLTGGTTPHHYLLPEPGCTVVCSEGWGHGVPLLESEWTEEPEYLFENAPTRGSLGMGPDDRVVMVFSGPDQNFQTHWLTPEGEYSASGIWSQINGEVLDFGITDGDIHYLLWTDGVTQRLLGYIENSGTFPMELELGPHHGYDSTLAVIDEGVVVALDDGTTRLLHINQAGDILFEQPIPATSRIDVSPSGDVIAMANLTEINWADAQGNFLGSQEIDDVETMLGLVAIDDSHVVIAGGEPAPGNGPRAFLRAAGAMGPVWSHSYDRADAWCIEYDANTTREEFTGVAQLGDGTLVVTGVESLGHPYADDDYTVQPWIAHVSAAGDVLAFDRGFWNGRTLDVVARDDVAYVLMSREGYAGGLGEPYLRKYTF